MSDGPPLRSLRGRRRECGALDRLAADVDAGRSRVLVLRGEAGVGKSALVEYLVQNAAGARIARAVGVESEMEMAFAGLHLLCAPMLGHLDRLPAPQRDALCVAFGLTAGSAPDRFLVGLAVLSLLAEVAEDQPLVCVVDDAQWLDRVSAQTLAFVGRRLLAERVALVFAVRGPTPGLPTVADADQLVGLPELAVSGLRDDDARALLESAVPGRLDERVRDRIVAESHGNPLALLELPRGLTAAEVAGGFVRPDARPLAGRIEQSFLRRIGSLPAPTQRLLLVAAAEPVGDVPLLGRVVERLGIGLGAAAPAEAAGLVEIGAQVRFRHPLVRSAAYRAADPEDRRAAHHALAEATDPGFDPDRRAWHRALAAVEPDEAVAAELERSADRREGPRRHGGRSGVPAAGDRADARCGRARDPGAGCSPGDLRGRGARRGARAPRRRGDGSAGRAPPGLAGPAAGPDRLRPQARRPCPAAAARRGRPARTGPRRAGARGVPRSGRSGGLRRSSRRNRSDAPGGRGRPHGSAADPAARPADLLLDGLATLFTEGYSAGAAPLQRALEAFRRDAGRTEDDVMRWLWLTWPVAGDLWDDAAWTS